MVPPPGRRIRFGAFEADLCSCELFRDEMRLPLRHDAFQVLGLLLQADGQTVSRQQLHDLMWPGAPMDRPTRLNNAVRRLRAVLGDHAKSERLIETVSGRGYRLLTPVQVPAQPTTSQLPSAEPIRIAVFPFQCLASGHPECFCGGLTEQLIARLGRMCHHIAAVVSPQTRDSLMFPLQAGRELSCEFVLCGGVFHANRQCHVSARLLQVKDGLCKWSEQFVGAENDLIWIQEEIALHIARAISDTLPPRVKSNPCLVTRAETYRKFLAAVSLMNQMSEPAFRKARGLLEEVIGADPGFAPAYASSAITYATAGQYGPLWPNAAFGKVNELAARALALAPELPEAHVALGMAQMFHQADFDGAERSFRRAMALNPSNVLANQLYAQLCTASCRHSEAIGKMQRALELDPLSPVVGTLLACVYFFAGQLQPALKQIDRVLSRAPDCPTALASAGWVLTELGDHRRALEHYHRAFDAKPSSPIMMVNLAYGLAAAGHPRAALRLLKRVIDARQKVWVSSYWIALTYTRLGMDQEALAWFNQAEEEHDGWRILWKTDPRFRPPSAQKLHLVSFYDVISG